jgi:hypothetical protein
MADFGRFAAGKDSGPPSVGDEDVWKRADRPAVWSRFQPDILDHINMLGRQSDARAVLITPSVNVSEKQDKLSVYGSQGQRFLNFPPVPDAPNPEQYGALREAPPLEMSNPAPTNSDPYLTVADKVDQVPYATAETRGLQITHPQFTAPTQASLLARQPELAGMPPQITPQPLQMPDMAQPDIPPDLDSRLKEILATTAVPEPVRPNVSGGLKLKPLPFAPPPQGERSLNVVNVPPPPDMQPRGGIRPLSASIGMLMRMPAPGSTPRHQGTSLFQKLGNDNADTVFFIPHGDEKTARQVLDDHWTNGGLGAGLVSRSSTRSGLLPVDANQTMRLGASDENRAAVEHMLDGPAGQMVVALHNTRGGAFAAEKNRSDAIAENDHGYGGYILTTDQGMFDSLKAGPYNVILQSQVPKDSDMSTSRWAALKGRSYVNVEAVRGDFTKQKQMLKAVLEARRRTR